MVECGGLENRFTGAPGDEGSNPSSSASLVATLVDSHNRTFLCIEIKKVVFGWFSIAWLQSPLTDFGDKLGKLVIFSQRILPYNKGNYC